MRERYVSKTAAATTTRPMMMDSVTKRNAIVSFRAPRHFMVAISLKRSSTLMSIALAMPTTHTSKDTLMSQMVDSVMVITVTFGAAYLRGDIVLETLLVLVGSNYLFKATVALLDTGPLYLAVHYLRRYLDGADGGRRTMDGRAVAALPIAVEWS